MSHQWFQKPENALKRAHELVNMPNSDKEVVQRQKMSALEILHDTVTSKRNKVWQQIHEDVMVLYIDICIDLQLGRIVKDGLYQYRNLVLQQNPASLEIVIKRLIDQAEKRAMDAQKHSNAISSIVSMDIDDLEATETPEALLLSTTTSDSHRDRADRELLVPWLRFLWESYRNVLDILRCNSKLEHLYYEISIKAFKFCLEYTRKLEFRRLCDILRQHLSTLQKLETVPSTQTARLTKGWDGWSSESVELHLQLRYEQLEAATKLEHWTEGFRTIEDIHAVMGLVDKAPKVSLMATYYEKLTQIFWVSKNYLFHAYALYKFYSLSKNQNTKLNGDELKMMASSVLLASLSIPIMDEETDNSLSTSLLLDSSANEGSSYDAMDIAKEKTQRMASLMGFTTTPTRSHLLELLIEDEDIFATGNILSQIVDLYEQLEKQFNPLEVVKQVKPILESLEQHSELKRYIPALETLLVQRLLSQLTQVYSSVTIAYLKSLLQGLNFSFYQVEQLIVRSVQAGYFNIKIDHRNGCLRFEEAALESKQQLTELATKLHECVMKLRADGAVAEEKVVITTKERLDQENVDMLNRKLLIEKKKEEIEQLQQEKALYQERKRQEFENQRQEMEKTRLEQEAKRREEEKRQRIKDEIALKETKQMLNRLGRDIDSIEDLQSIDREKIMREAKEKARQEKEEAQKKLQEQAIRLDFIVRATREAELPILTDFYQKQVESDRKAHETGFADTLERSKTEFEHAVAMKQRLQRMPSLSKSFVEKCTAKRIELYQQRQAQVQARKAVERLEKKIQRASERRDEDEMEREREEKAAAAAAKAQADAEALIEAARIAQEEAKAAAQKKQEEETNDDEWQHVSREKKPEETDKFQRGNSRSDARNDAPRSSAWRREERDESRDSGRFGSRSGRFDGPPRREEGNSRFGDRDSGRFDGPPRREEGNSRFGDRDSGRFDGPPRREDGNSRFGDRDSGRFGSSRFGDRDSGRFGSSRREDTGRYGGGDRRRGDDRNEDSGRFGFGNSRRGDERSEDSGRFGFGSSRRGDEREGGRFGRREEREDGGGFRSNRREGGDSTRESSLERRNRAPEGRWR